MRDITISKTDFDDASALPVSMPVAQYDASNKNLFEQKKINGIMSSGDIAFSIDCRHKCVAKNDEDESFYRIYSILQSLKDPTISRKFIDESFYLLRIADYSHQAMSAGFTDFVPLVFINGCKIQQRHVGMLKVYATRECYILIDKEHTNGYINGLLKKNIRIIISFKRNIEKKIRKRSYIRK